MTQRRFSLHNINHIWRIFDRASCYNRCHWDFLFFFRLYNTNQCSLCRLLPISIGIRISHVLLLDFRLQHNFLFALSLSNIINPIRDNNSDRWKWQHPWHSLIFGIIADFMEIIFFFGFILLSIFAIDAVIRKKCIIPFKKNCFNNGISLLQADFSVCVAIHFTRVPKFATLNDLFVVCIGRFVAVISVPFRISVHLICRQPVAIVTMFCLCACACALKLTTTTYISRKQLKSSQSHWFAYNIFFSLSSRWFSSRTYSIYLHFRWIRFYLIFFRCASATIVFLWSRSDRLQIDLRQLTTWWFFFKNLNSRNTCALILSAPKKHDLLYSKWLHQMQFNNNNKKKSFRENDIKNTIEKNTSHYQRKKKTNDKTNECIMRLMLRFLFMVRLQKKNELWRFCFVCPRFRSG